MSFSLSLYQLSWLHGSFVPHFLQAPLTLSLLLPPSSVSLGEGVTPSGLLTSVTLSTSHQLLWLKNAQIVNRFQIQMTTKSLFPEGRIYSGQILNSFLKEEVIVSL